MFIRPVQPFWYLTGILIFVCLGWHSAYSQTVTPLLDYEFNQESLADNGWAEIPGGFVPNTPNGEMQFRIFHPGEMASSTDQKGLVITVNPNETVCLYTQSPVDTQGYPVLLRLTVRSDNLLPQVALAVLKGGMLKGTVDGSIATHIPKSASSFVQTERRLVLVYQPDQGQDITPVIQVTGIAGADQAVILIDKLEILKLDAKIFGSEVPLGSIDQPPPMPTCSPTQVLIPTNTPTPKNTPMLQSTPTFTKTPTETKTATQTKTPTFTKTPTLVKTPTPTKTPTATKTPTPTVGIPYPSPMQNGYKTLLVNIPNLPKDARPLELVWIPNGSFDMGSPENVPFYISQEEFPQHRVTIPRSFYIGKFEVTQAQWFALMGANPAHFTGNSNLPVEQISWEDCQKFVEKLNQLGQGVFRLPTEAEWEYACRAGTATLFYWGDDINSKQNQYYAWYDDISDDKTHEVGQKIPNPWGLFDMSGNVWEWCYDMKGTYSPNSQIAPRLSVGFTRIIRGGSLKDLPLACRSAYRGVPTAGTGYIGLRIVREDAPIEPTPTPTSFIPKDNVLTVPLAGLPVEAKPLEMILIPAGTFWLGSPDDEYHRTAAEGPQHLVTITQNFYLSKYEITEAQWQAVMGQPAGAAQGNSNFPVNQLSWEDAQKFLTKLNSMSLGTFRLPMEAEWERACRAGTTTPYYWGEDARNAEHIVDHAWFLDNSGEQIHEVGLKQSNPWGLYDMIGNVSEWCRDWDGNYYLYEEEDPIGAPTGKSHIIRGGNIFTIGGYARSAFRIGSDLETRGNIGLRLLREYP